MNSDKGLGRQALETARWWRLAQVKGREFIEILGKHDAKCVIFPWDTDDDAYDFLAERYFWILSLHLAIAHVDALCKSLEQAQIPDHEALHRQCRKICDRIPQDVRKNVRKLRNMLTHLEEYLSGGGQHKKKFVETVVFEDECYVVTPMTTILDGRPGHKHALLGNMDLMESLDFFKEAKSQVMTLCKRVFDESGF